MGKNDVQVFATGTFTLPAKPIRVVATNLGPSFLSHSDVVGFFKGLENNN